MLTFLKARCIEIASGILASAIFSLLVIPGEQADLTNLGLGLVAVPIFLVLVVGSVALYLIYAVVRIIEIIAAKIGIIDIVGS